MSSPNRREFLQSTGAALAAGALLGGAAARGEAAPERPPSAEIPPHRPLPLEGVHVYTDRVSVAAGEKIRFHVSSTHPYELQVCRLGLDVDSPKGDEVLHSWRVDKPLMQPIHPGSYIHVEKGLADEPLQALTLECWVRLWDLPGEQGLIGQFDRTKAAGYALLVRRDSSLAFYLGDGGPLGKEYLHETPPGVLTRTETSPPAVAGENRIANGGRTVKLARWHHVVATFDGRHKELWIDGRRAGRWPFAGQARSGKAPLRIGSVGKDGLADDFLDADVAMPAIYSRALGEKEIKARYETMGLEPAGGEGVLACWPLTEERGDRVADVSGHGRHGRIINHATWMIGGPSFHADVERFGNYDPAKDPRRGRGLRLASDDLYDCRWQPTFEYEVPKTARSGIYVGRARFERHGGPRIYHVLFIVKKPADRPKTPIAFLASTNTWRAYAGTPFAETWPGIKQTIGHAYVNTPGNPPEFSCYWQHRAGQGTYQMGLRLPWPVVGPYTFHQDLAWECSHLCHADRLTLVWLEKEGYDFDVYSDLDLHQQPGLLDGYKTVFVVGHSEYWSAEGMAALERYLRKDGTVICLSGNTMFWRVSFNASGTIMECRKVDAPGSQLMPSLRGEIWHSHDGQRGGMARECGHPAWPLIGLEYMSMHAVGVEGIGPYRVVAADHPFFNHPHALGLKKGDRLGESPRGMPELIGHEGDVRVSTLAKICRKPLPKGATQPEKDPDGITLLADGIADWAKVTAGAPWDYFQRPVLSGPERTAIDVACEMIDWKRPDGGRIFNAGSVSSGRGFANDPKFGLLIKNVLHHFGVKPR